jgi:hypothetical protein
MNYHFLGDRGDSFSFVVESRIFGAGIGGASFQAKRVLSASLLEELGLR